MADKIKAILLRPLNGAEVGSEAEYTQADFDRLKARGAIKAAPKAKADAGDDNTKSSAKARK